MSVKDKAQGALGGAVAERLRGEKPGAMRAGVAAAVVGGLASVVVFRLLRSGEDKA